MFGTIFSLKPQPGQEENIQKLFETWESDRGSEVEGVIGGYLFKTGYQAGEMTGVAIFSSPETFRDNAATPTQDEWYRRLRALLVADPEWHDSEVIMTAHKGLVRGL
jgi:hypothetical protein